MIVLVSLIVLLTSCFHYFSHGASLHRPSFTIEGTQIGVVKLMLYNLEDILQALEVLDSINKVPNIYCEATDLLNMPPSSLDPVSEQVASNSQALESLVATVVRLEQQLTSLS